MTATFETNIDRRVDTDIGDRDTGYTPPSRAARIRLTVLLGALTAIAPLSIDMYLPALPSLTDDLAASASLVQLTLTACVVGIALGQVVAGPLSDAFGRRRPLLIGITLYTVASLLCVVAPSVGALIALRLIQGATGAAGIVIARAVVRDMYTGTAAARYFASLMLVTGVTPVLAPVIGGQLLRFTSWRGVFVIITVIGVILVTAAVLFLRETLPTESRSTGGLHATRRAYGEILTDRVFMGYVLSGGLAFAALFAYVSGAPFVLQDIYNLSPQGFSAIFAVNSVGIITVAQVSGRLAGRVALATLLRIGLSVSLAGAALLLVAVLSGAGLPMILPALFLVVSSVGLIMPNVTALALSERPSRVAGSASATVGVAQFVIGGVTAPLVGVAGSHTAVPMALVIAAASLSATLTFIAMVHRAKPVVAIA